MQQEHCPCKRQTQGLAGPRGRPSVWGHSLHEHVSTSTNLLTVMHPQRAHLPQWREGVEGGQTDTAMHTQQQPEDRPPPCQLGSTRAAPSPSAALPAQQQACRQCSCIHVCCAKHLPSSPTQKGRQGEQGMHKTQGMIQRPHWGSREEMSWAKDRSPALSSYRHHVPAALMSTRSTLPWPAPPFLATGAAAALTAALSCCHAWLAVAAAASCSRSPVAVSEGPAELSPPSSGSQLCWCPTAPHGHQGWSRLPRGCTASAHGRRGQLCVRPRTNTTRSLGQFGTKIIPLLQPSTSRAGWSIAAEQGTLCPWHPGADEQPGHAAAHPQHFAAAQQPLSAQPGYTFPRCA